MIMRKKDSMTLFVFASFHEFFLSIRRFAFLSRSFKPAFEITKQLFPGGNGTLTGQ